MWTLFIQIMPEQDAAGTPYNPFDLTKVWPHKDYPLVEVGVMELNRNAANYFAEIEQAAFAPSNIVPGIGFSPDKMLQASSSPMQTRTGTGWARITRLCRLTRRIALSTIITRTALCGFFQTIRTRMRITSPIPSTDPYRRPSIASRPCT